MTTTIEPPEEFYGRDAKGTIEVGDWIRWWSNIGRSCGEVIAVHDDHCEVFCDGEVMEIGYDWGGFKGFKPVALRKYRSQEGNEDNDTTAD